MHIIPESYKKAHSGPTTNLLFILTYGGQAALDWGDQQIQHKLL